MSKLIESMERYLESLEAGAERMAQDAIKENRQLTADEAAEFDRRLTEARKVQGDIAKAREDEQRVAQLMKHHADTNPDVAAKLAGQDRSAFGSWLREARNGDQFDMIPVLGAENRAIARRGALPETRAMSATGGVAQDGVYGTVWSYAVQASEILQAGVDVIATSDGNTIPFPVVTAHATPASGTAGAPLNNSDSVATTVPLSATKYDYYTDVPTELFQDAAWDVEGYISENAGIQLGIQIGSVAASAAVSGFTVSGATAPTASVAASAGGVFSDALITLFHSVITPYRANASWLMSDRTVAAVRKAKDGLGQYVWQSGLVAGDPGLIYGKGVFSEPSLPDPTGTSKIIYFGNWKALKVRIAGGLRFERSDQAAWKNDCISFRAIVRTGAAVVDPNAVKFLQLTAS